MPPAIGFQARKGKSQSLKTGIGPASLPQSNALESWLREPTLRLGPFRGYTPYYSTRSASDVPDQRLDGVFGVAPLFLISSVSRSTALSIGRVSATSIGVLPRPSFSSRGVPLSARN